VPDNTPQQTPPKAKQDEREFSAALLDLDRGKVHDDATTALADVIEWVGRTSGKGKVILTVEVEPQDPKTHADTGVLLISGKVEAKCPRFERAASIFYADGLRGITRDDPHRDDAFRDRD